jgi:hypothetical protein
MKVYTIKQSLNLKQPVATLFNSIKGGDETMKEKRMTRQESIRAKCLDCSNGSAHEVKMCPIKTCALYRYRLGYEVKDELYKQAHGGK